MTNDGKISMMEKASVFVYEPQCNGCVVCVKACPTKAIRIQNERAVILLDNCVHCGECIRVCPQKAISPKGSTYKDTTRFKVTALLPSPVIYTQFGDEIMPNEVLLALTKLGFDHVFDLAKYCEWGHLAVSDWLAGHPEVRTAISPICPVVTNLIARRFPDLIPNIIPLNPPREFGARHIRRLLAKRYDLDQEDIGIFHVAPCPAKMVAASETDPSARTHLSGVLSLASIYGDVFKSLKTLTDEERETILFQSGGCGMDWEAGNLPEAGPAMSVSGISETLDVLEQLESGRLNNVRYIEFRVCQGGCLGGPLTVENRYMAQMALRKLVQMFGTMPRVRPRQISTLIEEGFFATEREIKPVRSPLDHDPIKAMKKLKKVDELTARLPGKLCAVCGAPDCRTLAEDIVLGRADLFVCPIYFRLRTWGKHTMTIAEIVEKLGLTVLAGKEVLNREVSGVYAGDLLSDVMANSKAGQLWITLQAHINVVAVASLRELSGILLVNNREPTREVLDKAEEEGVPVLTSELSTYELSGRLYSLLAG